MQPFQLSDEIERRYADYIRTTFPFADPELARRFKDKIEQEKLLGSGPIVALQRPFLAGATSSELAESHDLHPKVAAIFPGWRFHAHQVNALRRLSERGGRRSTLISTGTGSGKTESFLLPILDYCARHPGPGVRAVLVYPMNALANDQLERLRGYLHGTGITFGRYTGDTPQTDGERHPGLLAAGNSYTPGGAIPAEECFSREAIRKRQPNLLITGYRMLEYLLVRREDQRIFRPDGGASHLTYLVLDEVHTYAGALGAEVACLVRRLRGHVEKYDRALTCVGASATVGEDQRDATLEFASKLFAVPFDRNGIVSEEYAEPPTADSALMSVDIDQAQIDELATARPLTQEEAAQLYEALDRHPTIVWLRRRLVRPRKLDDITADLVTELGASGDEALRAARRQIAYYLLQGTLARNDEGALLRPRLHVFHRGINGATQCLRCSTLIEGGATECPDCDARAVPLEICRQCGQDYLRVKIDGSLPDDATLSNIAEFKTLLETPDDLRETSPSVIRFLRRFAKTVSTDLVDDDTDEEADEKPTPKADSTIHARVCTSAACGHVQFRGGAGPCASCGDEDTTELRPVGLGILRKCPACRSTYGAGLEPITALSSGTAIGVSILTWLTLSNLPEDQRRLLIFADSRQDTAYQAGYLQDVTSEYSWRQLTYRVVVAAKDDMPDLDGFWNKLFEAGRTKYGLFTNQNAAARKSDLRWFVLQEFSRESQRRASLEGLGLVTIEYRYLEELTANQKFSDLRSAAPGVPDKVLIALLATVLDLVRRSGALSDDWTRTFWQDVESIRGLDQYNRRPVGFRAPEANPIKSSYATIRPFISKRGKPTTFEKLFSRVGISDEEAAIKKAVEILLEGKYLLKESLGASLDKQKVHNLLVANTELMGLAVNAELWNCTNCGSVNVRNVADLCIRPTCDGRTLKACAAPSDDNFYARMYREKRPTAVRAAEHSGQLSGSKREEYEHEFREGKLNVLVASPTLELGVDIGALTTVLLRGLPPSPANYAQRAGRAGRRERIALVASYAQSLPHDAYFYGHPDEIISGSIPAPQFELDNPTIVKRHIRSLALEKLENKLPTFMIGFLDLSEKAAEAGTDDYLAAKLRTDLPAIAEIQRQRAKVISAVEAAFRDERSFEVLSSASIAGAVDAFEHDLLTVLMSWLGELKEVAADIAAINAIAVPTGDDARRRRHLEMLLRRMTSPDRSSAGGNEAYTLGYLANHGFLPSYAFPGEQATLFSRDLDSGEILRDPLIALSEFAPGAIVYIDGKKIRSNGLNLARSSGGSVEDFLSSGKARYAFCAECRYHAASVWLGDCPECGSPESVREENRLEIAAFRGSADAQITASEEQRRRTRFDVGVTLFGQPESKTSFSFDALTLHMCRNQPLLAVNRGLRTATGAAGFLFCLDCGDVRLGPVDWKAPHLKQRKHNPKEFNAHLTHAFKSAVLLLEVPSYNSDDAVSLRHTLLAAIRIEFQAEDGELDGFEIAANPHRPATIALFETTNGGSGYLRRAAADLPRIARRAISILNHEPPCVRACYACLLTYYNQRDHGRIDKRLVEPLLLELAGSTQPIGDMSNGEFSSNGHGLHESPIEVLLDAAMRRNLPPYALQNEVLDVNGFVVSRPDMLFELERVAVYADGHEFHSSPEQLAHDGRVRSRMRELGYKVLVFSGSRIANDAVACVAEIAAELAECL